MKIAIIFADMLRPNRFSLFNHESDETMFDQYIQNFGGTIYKNCFTPGPDTPRGMSSIFTGISSIHNGCNLRLKWPREFLNSKHKSIFDLFLSHGYKIDALSDPRERAVGLFPKNVSHLDIHNDKYDINKFTDSLEISDNHMVFISLPQFHWTFDAYGATYNAEKIAIEDVTNSLSQVFSNLDKNLFDHIFIFSDHGFKFLHQIKLEPKYLLLNDDRIQTVMIHRKKFQENIEFDNTLTSVEDLFPTISEILDGRSSGFSLFAKNNRKNIVIEDHIQFMPEINQNIELWAVVDKINIYIRDVKQAHLLNRNSGEIIIGDSKYFDEILISESSYKRYKQEYEKIFVYSHNLLSKVGDDFDILYDKRRKKRNFLINLFFQIKDLTFNVLLNFFKKNS